MGSSYFPDAYGGGRLDFSGIESLGDSIGGAIGDYRSKTRLENAMAQATGPDGSVDYNKLTTNLLSMGDKEGAAIAASIGNKVTAGGMTPYQREMLDIQRQGLAAKPPATVQAGNQTKQWVNGQWKDLGPPKVNVPANYEVDPDNPGRVRPIPGGPATKLPQGDAGALAMLKAAEGEWNLPRENGQPLHTALTEPYTMMGQGPLQFEAQARMGAGDVGRAQRVLRTKVEAALRMMTGAAAPEQEVTRYTDFYTPSSMDRKETAEQKMRLLDGFVKNAEQFMLRGREGEPPNPFQDAGSPPPAQQSAPGAASARERSDLPPVTAGERNYPEAGPVPSQNDMAQLRQFSNNPQFRAEFESIYGAGSVDRWLNNEGWTTR